MFGFGIISMLVGLLSSVYSVVKASKNNASSFMHEELQTYYLGTKGIR